MASHAPHFPFLVSVSVSRLFNGATRNHKIKSTEVVLVVAVIAVVALDKFSNIRVINIKS